MLPSTPPRADVRPAGPGLCLALDAADDLVGRLQANVADLAARVSGLLMATPAAPGPELAAVPSAHAEITGRVYRINEGMLGAILMLTDLLDRLEV